MAKLIDGKLISAEIRAELKAQVNDWKAAGHRAPQLTAVLIGEDPASCTYVRNKMKVHNSSYIYIIFIMLRCSQARKF